MTLRDLILAADRHPAALGGVALAPVLLAAVAGLLHPRGRGGSAPWKYVYSVLVYLVCVPGMFAAVLTGYALFFRRDNLLDASLLIYFAPLLSMGLTLGLIARHASFRDLPGFDRLSGLMTLLGLSFAVALALDRTRIWLFFGGSFERLLVVAAAVFLLLRWAARRLLGHPSPPSAP